jgi:hypothetical protein
LLTVLTSTIPDLKKGLSELKHQRTFDEEKKDVNECHSPDSLEDEEKVDFCKIRKYAILQLW